MGTSGWGSSLAPGNTCSVSPLAADGLIYSACDSTVYGIDPFSGDIVWTVAVARGKVLSGAFYDDYLYVPVAYEDSGQLLRIDPVRGRLLDYVDLPAPPINFLTVEGGLGYLALDAGNASSSIVAIDLAGMSIKWIRDSIKGRVLEYPIPVGSGLLYILSNVGGHGRLYLLDAMDGGSPLPWWIYNLTIWDTMPWRTTNGLVQGQDFLVGVYYLFHTVYMESAEARALSSSRDMISPTSRTSSCSPRISSWTRM